MQFTSNAHFKTNENLILVKKIEAQTHPNKYIRITFQRIDVLDHFSQGVVASTTRRILLLSSHINLNFTASLLARVGGAGSLYITDYKTKSLS